MSHLLISKIYGYCIYALAVFTKKIKPKPNTLVFDLGFDWRKEWDSLRDIISRHLFSLDSSYTSLIFIIFLSLSRAMNFFCIVKMKTGYSRFPQAGVLRLDFRYRSNANDGNKLPRTSSRHLSAKTKGRICFKIMGYCRFRLHAFVINLSLVKRNTYSTYSCLMNIYDLKFFFRF